MKFAYGLLGVVLSAASFGASATVVTDRVDEIFIQCADCAVAKNTDAVLGYVKIALSAYASAASSNGWGPVKVGNQVQIEKYTQTPGGYLLVDHYYTIKNLPVTSFNDLIDGGVERDSDVRAVPARAQAEASMKGDVASFVESFSDSGGVTTIYGFFPQN
ncbi:hypothetical protein [Xanthomonas sp. LMG 12461]|uniref:hypothetical protein n=1 Tax=Xanthomonas sp. LMG 12461 TaxID=2014543 RepID=UPI00126446E1|nr:hypothetical protein [Xanthomonas sp. LMG 12461]KAB7763588.1 hypothetical protein CEK68_15415 [Xanthomonas sp. LMG 12461]